MKEQLAEFVLERLGDTALDYLKDQGGILLACALLAWSLFCFWVGRKSVGSSKSKMTLSLKWKRGETSLDLDIGGILPETAGNNKAKTLDKPSAGGKQIPPRTQGSRKRGNRSQKGKRNGTTT